MLHIFVILIASSRMKTLEVEGSEPAQHRDSYILITGGFGYIGSHTLLALTRNGYKYVVIDDFSNSSPDSVFRISQLVSIKIPYVVADIKNTTELRKIFTEYKISSVIHFAGFKSVSESVSEPMKYYENNVVGTLNILKVMEEFKVKNIVFSSSATVYGNPHELPITESHPSGNCFNPYGRCKYFIEQILNDNYNTKTGWKISILRYFNPIGADSSGMIGEDPKNIPNNLLPYLTQVAVGRLPHLSVYGSDYPTRDGTGIRDYIHVVDLANGHVKALEHLQKSDFDYFEIFNLGTGRGHSVLEVVSAVEKVTGKKVPFKVVGRREGDVAECYADVSKAETLLSWKASYSLEDMCRDAWNWQSKNPYGYTKKEF